jgi:2-keto-4-pentenoate hydratase
VTSLPHSPAEETLLDQAAEAFISARKQRPEWPGIPPALRPRTVNDGYRLQKRIHEKLDAKGVKRVGYKVAATTKMGQQPFGLAEPAYAGLFETSRCSVIDSILTANLAAPMLECEVALILGRELDGAVGVSPEAAAAAVATCHIACELVDNRYGDPSATGAPSLIADDWFNVSFVLGSASPNWRALDLKNLHGTIQIDGIIATGHSANVPDAITSLCWLAGKLAQSGRKLDAGEIVMTGSVVPPTKFTPPVKSISLSLDGFEPMQTKRIAS